MGWKKSLPRLFIYELFNFKDIKEYDNSKCNGSDIAISEKDGHSPNAESLYIANDPITSDFATYDSSSGEIVYDSEELYPVDNELCGTSSKPVPKQESKISATSFSLWQTIKPRISIQFVCDERKRRTDAAVETSKRHRQRL